MRKFFYWGLKIISVLLLIVPLLLIIPGFIFGPIYLGITAYLAKQGQGGINHSAHLWGSLYGVVFLIVAAYFIAQFNVVASFVEQIRIYLGM